VTAISRGRILRATGAEVAPRIELSSAYPLARSRRLAAVEAAAMTRARMTLEAAEIDAEAIRARARARAAEVELDARTRAQADALATLAAALCRANRRERLADEGSLERALDLATLIAERLLGEALNLQPARIRALAESALASAAGARSLTLEAHPDDAEHLSAGFQASARRDVVVRSAMDLSRGDLRIITDLGTIDARLGERIGYLAKRIEETIRG
jgi:flagellar biosynthesis/type III secretory pathway protein FliH